MKRAVWVPVILLLASLRPVGAEDFEPFWRIALRGAYTYIPYGPKYGPVGEVRAFWGSRWFIGLELQYSHLYNYEHAWDDSGDEIVRTPPDIWQHFGGGVMGGVLLREPQRARGACGAGTRL